MGWRCRLPQHPASVTQSPPCCRRPSRPCCRAYNSAASFAQIAGLSYTTATRGAFLVQASTLFTPALSALAGMPPSGWAAGREAWSVLACMGGVQCSCAHRLPLGVCPPFSRATACRLTAGCCAACRRRRAWLGSCVALGGTLVIAADRASGSAAASEAAAAASSLRLGDGLTLLAALCYSAACVRLPAWAVQRGVQPLQLALGKSAFLSIVALAALAVQASQLAAAGQPAAQLWPGWQQPQGWAIVLWAALGPGALASVLHVKVCQEGWVLANLSSLFPCLLARLHLIAACRLPACCTARACGLGTIGAQQRAAPCCRACRANRWCRQPQPRLHSAACLCGLPCWQPPPCLERRWGQLPCWAAQWWLPQGWWQYCPRPPNRAGVRRSGERRVPS